MLENENKTAQTTEESSSATVVNAGNGQTETEVNDVAFSDTVSTDNQSGNGGADDKSEKTEEKPKQTKETNTENARRRREVERQRELTAVRNKTILDVLGNKNPYTNEEMKDDADVEEYLTMKEIAASGRDPVADFSRYKKQKERERQEAVVKAESEREWYRKDAADFAKAHPDVDINTLATDELFTAFAGGKIGKVPLAKLYDEYVQIKSAAVREYQDNAAKELANKKASPGALGGGGGADRLFTRDEVKKMSPAEQRKNYDKIRESMTKW